jgi:hypothetical protein
MGFNMLKNTFDIGDLIGLARFDSTGPDRDHVTELGVVHYDSTKSLIIIWDNGWESGSFPTSQAVDTYNWVNFGPDTPQNRLAVALKYLQPDES